MKRKIRGSIFMAAVLMAVSLAATPLVAFAKDHKNPENGLPCNNTYYYTVHTTVAHSYQIGAHWYSNGQICNIIQKNWYHQDICTSCGAIVRDNYILECEVEHSLCGSTTIKH